MRFRDQRKTYIKGQPIPEEIPEEGQPPNLSKPRMIAAPKAEKFHPEPNRASRRLRGQHRLRRGLKERPVRKPLPWKEEVGL